MKQPIKCVILVSLIAVGLSLPKGASNPTKPQAKTDTKLVTKPVAKTPAAVTSNTAVPEQSEVAAVPVVAPAPTPIVYPVGCQLYLPLVEQYSWPVSIAMAVMQAESSCNPNNISPASINWDDISDFGLFQLHGMDVLDPATNVADAYNIKYAPSGTFNAWTTFTSGKYLQYLQ